MKCKKCGAEVVKGHGYPGKKMCHSCYQQWYIKNKWKNNPEYRKKQTARVVKWQKAHPERVLEIARGVYRRIRERKNAAKKLLNK